MGIGLLPESWTNIIGGWHTHNLDKPAKYYTLTPERENLIKWASTHNPTIILGD